MAVFLVLAASFTGFLAAIAGYFFIELPLLGALGLWILPGPVMALMSMGFAGLFSGSSPDARSAVAQAAGGARLSA